MFFAVLNDKGTSTKEVQSDYVYKVVNVSGDRRNTIATLGERMTVKEFKDKYRA